MEVKELLLTVAVLIHVISALFELKKKKKNTGKEKRIAVLVLVVHKKRKLNCSLW